MPVVKIGSSNYKDCLKERFELEIGCLKNDNYEIEISQFEQGDILFFKCSVADKGLVFRVLKEFIANILSDLIINHLEIDFLYRILNFNCQELNKAEKDKIIDIALNRLNILSSKTDEVIKAKFKRKNKILVEIVDYITSDQEIVLEGFVRFRLKKYLTELELAVKNAIEEYGIEKEYREFIYLLKYYVDQQTNNNQVNVIKINNNEFKLLDKTEKIIENPLLDEYVLGQLQQELEQEDLIISALISIAPQEIILHFKRPFKLVENLKNIFKERVSICLGCDYCKIKNSEELKEKILAKS